MASDYTYSAGRKTAHWLTAAAMAVAFTAVWTREIIDEPALRATLMGWHKSAGFAVLLLALWRLALRARHGAAPALPGQPRLQVLAAALVHTGLYALMLAQPLLGWAYLSAKGRAVDIGPLHLPALLAKSPALAEILGEAHEVAGAVLAIAIALHLGATVYHALWQREPILARMLPSLPARAGAAPVFSGEQK